MSEVKPEMRFTEQEIATLRATFKGNLPLVKLMRKVFLPPYDPSAPIGQTVDSIWMGLDQLAQMNPQDREMIILTQIRMNNLIERGLLQLQVLSEMEEESPEQIESRRKKDSAK